MQINEAENLISIIIPTREQDFILDECILNIRNLYKQVKIIVIIDKDNEKTYDKNVKILKSQNKNMSAKRNLGVKNADTKYIALIDSDAYPCEGWLENSINLLEQDENYSAVTGNQYNPQKDNFLQRCLRIVRFSRIFTHGNWCVINDKNAKEREVNEFSSANVVLTKVSYENINGMNEDIYLAEDNEFSLRYKNAGYKIKFSPKTAVFHRESTMYPFLRKLYCMSYYYADMFRQGKAVKPFKQILLGLMPMYGFLFFLFLWCFLIFMKINPYPLLILPLIALLILVFEACNLTKQLEEGKILGFFIFLYTFCAFIAVWILGGFLGLIPIKFSKVENLYKHY